MRKYASWQKIFVALKFNTFCCCCDCVVVVAAAAVVVVVVDFISRVNVLQSGYCHACLQLDLISD